MTKWNEMRLHEISTVAQGGKFGLSGNDFVEDGYPAFGAGGMNGQVSTFESERTAVILSSIGARCGKCFYVSGRWTSLANTQIILPDLSKVDPRFLWYQLNNESGWHRSGTAQPFIKPLDVKNRVVRITSLAEQQRIAAILDQAEALRGQRRAALAQLDELGQSVFVEMFGDPGSSQPPWRTGRIADLIESTAYGTSEKSSTSGSIPVLRMGNITYGGETDLRDLRYMELSTGSFDRYTVRAGDLLFNRTNSAELVGKSAVYRMQTPAAFAGYLIRVRSNELSNTTYLAAFLNSRYGKRKLRSMAKSIVGMANINAKELRDIPIAQPPIELQNEFADQVRAIESLKVTHRTSLAELDALFASLQHRAFRGEL